MKIIRKGFSLIEILVVIVIIAILLTVATTNMVGARQRAIDSQRKSNLKELKLALRMYYVDYHQFPATNMGIYLNGCGTNGTSKCPICPTSDFASGGADGCLKTYANKLEMNESGVLSNIRYYQCANGDDFRLKIQLNNMSDADILLSQSRCPACGTTYSSNDYVLCND